jgi:ABC-type uncharacterized transport system substrate-binding protein
MRNLLDLYVGIPARVALRACAACAILGMAHSAQASSGSQGPRCTFPPARVGASIAYVTAKGVEGAEAGVDRLRDALARRRVEPPPIDLLLVDESDPSSLGPQVAALPLDGRAAIVTLSGHIARALAQRRLQAPTVFATIVDPVAWGNVEANATHQANVTGITYHAEHEWKYLEHLRTAFPSTRRVGILADRYFFEKPTVRSLMQQAGQKLAMRPEAFVATSLEELEAAFADPRAALVDAWIVPETPVVFRHEARVLELVGRRKVPNIFGHPSLLAKGALMVFGVEFGGMHDEIASILRMICAGTPARDIPIVRARHVFLGVSLTNAKARGIRVDPRIVPLATTVH